MRVFTPGLRRLDQVKVEAPGKVPKRDYRPKKYRSTDAFGNEVGIRLELASCINEAPKFQIEVFAMC